MARKSKSEIVGLICQMCKRQNYVTTRNKLNMEEKLVLKKFCSFDKKVTEHKESVKLK